MKQAKKYFIFTFGCQMNKSDSERIAGDYQARGYIPAKNVDEADEIVINTCAVRQRAEDRVVGLINNLAEKFRSLAKSVPPRRRRQAPPSEESPASRTPKIILTGCMIHHGEDKLRQMLPQVDEILPISEVGFNSPAVRRDKHHAWVPISNGCNSFCSYCIVPFSRGREKSRPEAGILKEIRQLAEQGHTEITLVGQNVNSYGLEKVGIGLRKASGFQGRPPFVALLEKVCHFNQLKKIRFITSNPWDFSDALIDCIEKYPQIDRFIHLPVQSGSNRILKLMNRGYTRQDYLRLVKKLRRAVPDVQLGTDIIVGFPTETDEDFQATVDLAEKVDWQVAFVAQYSPRPGTASYKLYSDDVPAAVKKQRFQILDKLINLKHMSHRPRVIK